MSSELAAILKRLVYEESAIDGGRSDVEWMADASAALSLVAERIETLQQLYDDFAPWCVGFFGRDYRWPSGIDEHLRDLRMALALPDDDWANSR